MAQRILIVGCSDGIGLATVKLLLARGHTVTGISRSPTTVVDPRYTHVVADVATNDYPATLAKIIGDSGPFEVCIYCAGIGGSFHPLHIAMDERVFRVNLLGALATAQEVLPTMVKAGRGHFVVLSSQADELIIPDAPSYSASKAAMSAYFEGIGLALRKRGVAITNLRFGFVETKMARARHKPFCISVDKAARIVEGCLTTKPLRRTRPLRMAILVAVLRWLQRWQIRLA